MIYKIMFIKLFIFFALLLVIACSKVEPQPYVIGDAAFTINASPDSINNDSTKIYPFFSIISVSYSANVTGPQQSVFLVAHNYGKLAALGSNSFSDTVRLEMTSGYNFAIFRQIDTVTTPVRRAYVTAMLGNIHPKCPPI